MSSIIKKPSGAEFKKRKREKDAAHSKGLQTLSAFISKKPKLDNIEISKDIIEPSTASIEPSINNIEPSKGHIVPQKQPIVDQCVQEKPEQSQPCNSQENIDISNAVYPSDRGLYGNQLSSNMLKSIIVYGSCRPRIDFPKDENNRSFSEHYYSYRNKLGMILPRAWLCYSPTMNSVYCEPC